MLYSSMKTTTESNTMTLSGTGQVTAVPDVAILRLGVQTSGEDLAAAQAENARLSQAVLQSLRQLGITDIKTYQYEINKLYDYEDSKRIDKGYSVRNILEIRMANMDQVGIAIDTAVSNGANVVDLIDFKVSNNDIYYTQALNLAVMNAYQKACSIATSLGIMLNPIPRSIIESGATPTPSRLLGVREGAATTPIEAGTEQIEANVTVVFIY